LRIERKRERKREREKKRANCCCRHRRSTLQQRSRRCFFPRPPLDLSFLLTKKLSLAFHTQGPLQRNDDAREKEQARRRRYGVFSLSVSLTLSLFQ